jgi:hypothetical protein
MHEDLINAACSVVYPFFIEERVSETLANETALALATHINAQFESELAEYKISAYFNKPYASRAFRDKSVSEMAAYFSDLAGIAAIDCLEQSSLIEKGKDFCFSIVDLVKETVQAKILRLNEQSFTQGSKV